VLKRKRVGRTYKDGQNKMLTSVYFLFGVTVGDFFFIAVSNTLRLPSSEAFCRAAATSASEGFSRTPGCSFSRIHEMGFPNDALIPM
jgi:hypothetical protein